MLCAVFSEDQKGTINKCHTIKVVLNFFDSFSSPLPKPRKFLTFPRGKMIDAARHPFIFYQSSISMLIIYALKIGKSFPFNHLSENWSEKAADNFLHYHQYFPSFCITYFWFYLEKRISQL